MNFNVWEIFCPNSESFDLARCCHSDKSYPPNPFPIWPEECLSARPFRFACPPPFSIPSAVFAISAHPTPALAIWGYAEVPWTRPDPGHLLLASGVLAQFWQNIADFWPRSKMDWIRCFGAEQCSGKETPDRRRSRVKNGLKIEN